MPNGKSAGAALSPHSGDDHSASASASVSDAVQRRRSFTSAVSAFAAELRACPKKAFGGSARRDTTGLSLANAAARSKSCSNLPATLNASPSANVSENEYPLPTLLLESPSFLETTISENGKRLYEIKTKGARTVVSREDTVQGATHVGEINWVDDTVQDRPLGTKNCATVQMAHGRRYFVEEFLRRTKLTSSRMFNIPHYAHTLKWKRSGSSFKLVASKGKTTIAVLEPAVLGTSPQIKVYETLYEHDAMRPQLEHRGVPVFLLDYLVVTALLVVTEKDEWLQAANETGSSAHASSTAFKLGPQGSTRIKRWRLEVQTEETEKDPFRKDEITLGSDSRPSSLALSSSSIIDISPGKGEVDSESGASISQAWHRRASHLLTASPDSSSSSLRQSFIHSSLPSIPSGRVPLHPFASEVNEGEDTSSPIDGFQLRSSPLTTVFPVALDANLSLSDSSPKSDLSANQGGGSGLGSSSRRHSRTHTAESFSEAETPRQMSKSLPSTPTITARRPATAGAVPREGSRPFRPFRPLPRTPSGSAVLSAGAGNDVPPVPSLPARMRDPRVVSFSSGSPSVPESSASELSTASPNVEQTDVPNDGPRSIRRSASEATLLAKYLLEASTAESPLATSPDHENQHDRDRDRDPSLLKTVRRSSLSKGYFPSLPSLPAGVPPPSSPAPSRTFSAPSPPKVVPIPSTAPLRIRRTYTHNITPRASTSSSASTTSTSPSYRQSVTQRRAETVPEPRFQVHNKIGVEEEEEDEEVGECVAPPAYDTIDFSHPPLNQSSVRGIR